MRLPRPLQNGSDRLRSKLSSGRGTTGLIAAGVALIAALVVLAVTNPFGGSDNGETRVVTIAVATDNAQQAPVGTLGFPLVATRNTTRISGPDPTADAAAAALATHPPAPGARPLQAAILVPDDDWQAGVAASVLSGPPTRIPVLVSGRDSVPDATTQALAQLHPEGGGPSGDTQVYSASGAAVPSGLNSDQLHGDSPAEIANSIDQLRQRLLKAEPEHIVVVSSDEPGYAMPAAAWAARSGDAVLFSGRNQVPAATLAALRRHAASAVYVLGPESVISKAAVTQARQGGRERAADRRHRRRPECPLLRPVHRRVVRVEPQRSRPRNGARKLRPPARRCCGGVTGIEWEVGTSAASRTRPMPCRPSCVPFCSTSSRGTRRIRPGRCTTTSG